MSSPTRTTQRRRMWPFVVGGLVVLLVLVLVVVLWSNGGRLPVTPQGEGIGQGVTASGDSVPPNLEAGLSTNSTELPAGTVGPAWVTAAAPGLELSPAGPLPAPVTFTVPLTQALTDDEVLLVRVNHSHPFDAQAAETVPAELSADRKSAIVKLDQLSVVEVFKVSKKLVGDLFGQFINKAFSGAFSTAKAPTCSNQAGAEAGGYSFSPKTNLGNLEDTLQWCYGYEGTDRVVKATNNRRYPVEIDAGGFPVIDSGDVPVSMVEAYRLNHVVIMPRESMKFGVNSLNAGASTSLSSRGSNWGVGLTVVDAVAKAFLVLAGGVLGKAGEDSLAALKAGRLTMLDDFGLKGVQLKSFMEKLLSGASCEAALGSSELNIPKVISGCFTRDGLLNAAGATLGIVAKIAFGVAVAGFITAMSAAFAIIDMPRVLANFFADKSNGRDKYAITAARRKALPSSIVGNWYRHSTSLVIKADGTGTYLTRLYQTCTADKSDDCGIDTILSFAIVDATHVRATFKSVTYTSYNTQAKVAKPVAIVNQFYRPGDTMLLHVDQYHRLVGEDEGRLNNNTVDSQGVPADTEYYCGPQTDPNQTMLCGA